MASEDTVNHECLDFSKNKPSYVLDGRGFLHRVLLDGKTYMNISQHRMWEDDTGLA